MGSFIIPSCIVISQWLKIWREVAWNSGNPYHFHTKTSFLGNWFGSSCRKSQILILLLSGVSKHNSARLCPKMTKKSLKNWKSRALPDGLPGRSWNKIERATHTMYTLETTGNALLLLSSFCHYQRPKLVLHWMG